VRLAKEAEHQEQARAVKIAGGVILGLLLLVGIVVRTKRRQAIANAGKPATPQKPLPLGPHPSQIAWICQGCGWLGFLPGEGNPYTTQAVVQSAKVGVGAVGVAAGVGGLGLGLVVVVIGLVLIVIGIQLTLLFGIGILVMILGGVVASVGVGIMSLGGSVATAGAGAAAHGVAGGVEATQAAKAYAQRARPCPMCRNTALIPTGTPFGQRMIHDHPELLDSISTEIGIWGRRQEAWAMAIAQYEMDMETYPARLEDWSVEKARPRGTLADRSS